METEKEIMTRIRTYLRTVSLAMMAIGLMIPLIVYQYHTAGTGKMDPARWGVLTACFWIGLIIWISNRPKKDRESGVNSNK